MPQERQRAAEDEPQQELTWALDPLLAVLSRPAAAASAVSAPQAPSVPPELLDQLATRVLRRCSVGRDGATTTVRLELGEGRFEGAAVLVQSEHGRVSVRVEGDDRASCDGLERALLARLKDRGTDVVD